MHQVFQLVCLVLVLTTFRISDTLGEPFDEGEAKVELIKKRLRRSTATTEGGDVDNNNNLGEPAEDHPRNYEFDVRVTAFGISHDLKLTHAGSIFSSSFKYQEIYTNESGHVVWKDITPSLERLEELEDNIYHDVHTNTVVKVEHVNNGEINLNGIVNGAKIRSRRSLTDLFIPNSSNHVIQFPKIIHPPELKIRDYIEFEPAQVLIPREGVPSDIIAKVNAITSIEADLAFVIEKTLSDLFATDDDLLEYMAIMIKGVNSLYALTPVPKIEFKLVGLHRMKDENSQPFMAPAKKGDEYDLFVILDHYEAWANKNLNFLGPHDISPLQLGVNFTVPGLRGLATRRGACNFNVPSCKQNQCSAACPASQDVGGYFSGTFTLAHELGHSMGAPHDGEEEATACPFSDGFIMSYKGWGTLQHFKMSPCSLAVIRLFASTRFGKCLLELTKIPPAKSSLDEIGNKFNGDQICKKAINDKASVWDPSPDDSCRDTRCKLLLPDGEFEIGFTGNPVGNNAPCGEKGKCRNGYCVGQGTPKTLDELCSISIGPSWKFNQTFSDSLTTNDVCSRSGSLPCSGMRNGTRTDTRFAISAFGIDLPVGTICNPAKNLICFNKACVAQDSITHPEKECILHTRKMEAVKASLNCASNGLVCTYGTESEVLNTVGSSEGAACALGSNGFDGVCAQGKCTSRSTRPPVTSGGAPKGLLKRCSEETKDPNAKIIFLLDGPFDRNNYCKDLVCLKSDGTVHVQAGNIPDGTVCGPLRTCKNGKCIIICKE